MRNARIWILITDGVSARICSTGDGATTAITAPTELRSTAIGEPTIRRMSEAWYLLGGRNDSMWGATARFADHIAQILGEAAAEGAFDRLVIVAAPHIASEIERSLPSQARALMIGEIVRDLPVNAPVEPSTGAELRN
jgi:protein required for attachment to host cells